MRTATIHYLFKCNIFKQAVEWIVSTCARHHPMGNHFEIK